MTDHGWVIRSFASMRMWRQIGRIGFNQQAIRGNLGCDLSQFFRVFECDHAGKTDVHSPCKALFGGFPGTGKGMHDSIDGATRLIFRKCRKDVGFAFPHVHNERFSGLEHQFDVSIEPIALQLDGAEVPVAIQACFADCDRSRVGNQPVDQLPIVFASVLTLIGMDPYRGVDWLIGLRDFQAGIARSGVGTDGGDTLHADVLSQLKIVFQLTCQLGVVQVGMGVKKWHRVQSIELCFDWPDGVDRVQLGRRGFNRKSLIGNGFDKVSTCSGGEI